MSFWVWQWRHKMKQAVMLTIRGRQIYEEQEPEVIELISEGTLEQITDGWDICYEESPLTGLEGVTTTFRIRSDRIPNGIPARSAP